MSDPNETEAEATKRYQAAGHAVQTGVKMEQELGSRDTDPKHLRVGVNMAMVDQAGLVRLLIARGIITSREYVVAIADEAEREAARYEERLSKALGSKVTLL